MSSGYGSETGRLSKSLQASSETVDTEGRGDLNEQAAHSASSCFLLGDTRLSPSVSHICFNQWIVLFVYGIFCLNILIGEYDFFADNPHTLVSLSFKMFLKKSLIHRILNQEEIYLFDKIKKQSIF